MAIASFTAGVMSDEENPSAVVSASRPATDTPAALAASVKAPLLTATGSNTGNVTASALPSPAPAATTSPAIEVTNSVGDSIASDTATPTGSPVASAPAATISPATPTVKAKEATPPAPTLTPQRNTNASVTDTIGIDPVAGDSISKTLALANTQPASDTTTPAAPSSALPTQTALQNSQLSETPQAENSQALLPTTGQNAPPKTGASPRTRYFAIGLILLMLAGGVLAAPEDQLS